MTNITKVEYNNQVVIRLSGVAELLETKESNLARNFARNKDKFVEGVDYFTLSHSEAQNLDKTGSLVLQGAFYKGTKGLQLWTESGLAMQAKLVLTGFAWDLQRKLVDSFFGKVEPKVQNGLVALTSDQAKILELTLQVELLTPRHVIKDYYTVGVMTALRGVPSRSYNARKLQAWSERLGFPAKTVLRGVDAVLNELTFHKDVWAYVYGILPQAPL